MYTDLFISTYRISRVAPFTQYSSRVKFFTTNSICLPNGADIIHTQSESDG